MNKLLKIVLVGIAVLPRMALADLPGGTNTQAQQQAVYPYNQQYGTQQYPYGNQGYMPYGQGYGNGASYYNQSYYNQNQSLQYQQYLANAQANQTMQNVGTTSSDLLWLFTGSEGTLSQQMRSGFKSTGQTNFFGRFFSVMTNQLYRRLGPKVDRALGGLENRASYAAGGALNSLYNQGGAQGYCYDCALQNSTNPYYRSQQAINPALFGGNTTGTTTTPQSTISNQGGGAAGGISR